MGIAVVPVAGLGTRLLPLTKTQPKENVTCWTQTCCASYR